MKILPTLAALLLSLSSSKRTTSNAMFADEVGQNDFTIASAGHGQLGVTYAHISSNGNAVLTASSSSLSSLSSDDNDNVMSMINYPRVTLDSMKACYLTSRSLQDGSLNWRRNVCTTTTATTKDSNNGNDNNIRFAIYVNGKDNHVYSLDDTGIIQKWDQGNGNLIHTLSIVEMRELQNAGNNKSINKQNKKTPSTLSTIPQLIPISDTLLGCIYETKDVVSIFDMNEMKFIETKTTKSILNNNMNDTKINLTSEDGFVKDKTRNLQCHDTSVTIANGKLNVLDKSIDGELFGLQDNEDQSNIQFVKILKCEHGSMTVLITTTSGSTAVLDITFDERSASVQRKWLAEEAFGSITSTTFLDWNAAAGKEDSDNNDNNTNDDEEENALLTSLSFSSRLQSQYKSFVSFISGGFVDDMMKIFSRNSADNGKQLGQKELIFGLKKVALMLSNPFSKILAIDTASSGSIIWSMNLNHNALWHKVVHGASTSRSSIFGHGMHHPHSPEVLVLSQFADSLEWRCVDGISGRVISESKIPLSQSVAQIMPIHSMSHAGGGCRQNAILLLNDNTHVVVPDTSQSNIETSKTIASGLYTHKVDRESGLFTTMKIQQDSNEALVIGETLFDPSMEKIINVAYPQRNEVVQSPSTIVGDDSLLLKYLNPHLCVVVTEATNHLMEHLENEQGNSFYNALATSRSGSGSEKKPKKKPVGVTKPGEEIPTTTIATPTLFINVIDTVSGQILYRVSHSHVVPGSTLTGNVDVPVVISENWIIYAFPNAKSRRTELGVITLHEGMIDKKGITAFSTPEQQETFSSLTSPKPVALTKTYALSVPVSAIGVTNTKNGISSKNVLLATGVGGQVIRIDRRMLDPRRPSGEPKDTEKKEGLMQ